MKKKLKVELIREFETRKHPSQLKREKFGDSLGRPTFADTIDKDIAIDRAKLDHEAAIQPRLYWKYHKIFLSALKRRKRAESTFDGKKALMAKEIRKYPKRYGLDKVTESAVQMALPNHKDYSRAHEKYLDAYVNFKKWEGVMKDIEMRSYAIGHLEGLASISYYTQTSMSIEEFNPYIGEEE